jgi:mRNA interferase MazF
VTFDRFDVVRVPFPFTDQSASKNRPALVLSHAEAFNTPSGHAVMAMITSESNAAWPLDCVIHNLEAAGLPAPSKTRCKLFTLDLRLVNGRLGRLDETDRKRLATTLGELFKDR